MLVDEGYQLSNGDVKTAAQLVVDNTAVDLRDPAAMDIAWREETRLVWIETPTNPMLKLADLDAIVAVTRAHQRAQPAAPACGHGSSPCRPRFPA